MSEEQVFNPKPGVSLTTALEKFGRPLTRLRENAAWRVWRAGNCHRLGLTGPEANLTAVAVLCLFTPDMVEIDTGVFLQLAVTNLLLNPRNAEGGKWPEGDDLFNWMKQHIEAKSSGERAMNGRRVAFGLFSVCSALLITQPGDATNLTDAVKHISAS